MAQLMMVAAKAGARGWVVEVSHSELPVGVRDRQEVTVVAAERSTVVVRSLDGVEVTLCSLAQIDCGRFYKLGDTMAWLPERHPAVIEYLKGCVARLRAEVWETSIDGMRSASLKDDLWVLERNGHAAPAVE